MKAKSIGMQICEALEEVSVIKSERVVVDIRPCDDVPNFLKALRQAREATKNSKIQFD